MIVIMVRLPPTNRRRRLNAERFPTLGKNTNHRNKTNVPIANPRTSINRYPSINLTIAIKNRAGLTASPVLNLIPTDAVRHGSLAVTSPLLKAQSAYLQLHHLPHQVHLELCL